MSKISEEAKKLYNDSVSNHPTVHCNRFPSWEELKETDKAQWIQKAREKIKSKTWT